MRVQTGNTTHNNTSQSVVLKGKEGGRDKVWEGGKENSGETRNAVPVKLQGLFDRDGGATKQLLAEKKHCRQN